MLKKQSLHARFASIHTRFPSLRHIPLRGTKHHVPFSPGLLIARRRLGALRQHWGGRLEGCCSSKPTQVRTSKVPSQSIPPLCNYIAARLALQHPFFSSIPFSIFRTRHLRPLRFPFVALIITPFIGSMQPCMAASVPRC